MHHCDHCKQRDAEPIFIGIRGLGLGGSVVEVNFCCWECAAQWFNKRAGEILMPDLDSEFFGPGSVHMRKWG